MRRSSLTPSRSLELAATRATVATQTDDGETALLREMRARARATVAALGGAKGSLRCALPRAAAGASIEIAGQTQTRGSESSRATGVLRRSAGKTARALLLGGARC